MDLIKLQKKGSAKVDSKISYLIGGLIVVIMATALAPEMFTSLVELGNETLNPGVPTWVTPVLYVVVGAGIIFLIWRAFGNN